MKKNITIALIVLTVIIIGYIAYTFVLPKETQVAKAKEESGGGVELDKNYFDKLKGVIEGNSSAKEKEQAILEMAQYAVILNDTQRVESYLKEVAVKSKEENVVGAAYASIDLIKSYTGYPEIGVSFAEVNGDIKPNSTIKITLSVIAKKDCEGRVGITKITKNMHVIGPGNDDFALKSNESKEFEFNFVPSEEGVYYVRIVTEFAANRFETQRITHEFIFNVTKEGGSAQYLQN